MKGPIERIKNLIPNLPEKDIPLGYKFLETKNYSSLSELVDSAILRIKKNLKTDSPREEYININIDSLRKLKSEVDMYCILLQEDIDSDLDDLEDDSNYEENYY